MLKKIAMATLTAVCLSIGTPAMAASYLGNPNSMKFHHSWCRTIKHPENFVSFDSRDEAVSAGYVACKVCAP